MSIWIYIIIYWIWYFWSRPKAGWSFFGNLLYGVYLIVVVQGDLLEKLGLSGRLVNLNLWLMIFGIVLHHLSILSQYKGYGVVKLQKIHMQISHVLMFVPYGINSYIVSVAMDNYLFMAASVLIAVTGVLVGLSKVKLPY